MRASPMQTNGRKYRWQKSKLVSSEMRKSYFILKIRTEAKKKEPRTRKNSVIRNAVLFSMPAFVTVGFTSPG